MNLCEFIWSSFNKSIQVAAIHLLDPESLCISILSLKLNNDTYLENFPDEIQDIFNSIHFINYQQNEIKQISKEILIDHIPYFDVLQQHHFSLQINKQFLLTISQNYNSFMPYYPFVAQCILQFYLSWMLTYNERQTISFFNELLFNLILISETQNNTNLQKIQNYSISAFYHLVSSIRIQTLNNLDFTMLCENLKIYYSIEVTLPQEAYSLLSQTAKAILSLTPSKNTEDMKTSFFEYIISLLNSLDKNIPNDTVLQISNSLMPMLSHLDTKAITYFKCLSNYISNASHIYDVLTTAIYLEISQSDPFLVLNVQHTDPSEIEKEKLPALSAPEVTLRFWDKSVSEKWFNLKENIHLPDRKSDKSLVSPQLKVILDLIIESTHSKKELTMNLLDSFSFLTSKNNDNEKHSFYLHCIFLYICIEVKEFVRNEDIINILIDEPFFDPSVTIFNNQIDNEEKEKEKKEEEIGFEFIDSLRTSIVDIALFHMQSFDKILLKWIQYPHLFIEIVHRIIRNSHLHIDTSNVNTISRALMISSIYYQQLHYTDDTHTNLIETVRRSLFLLITQFMQLQHAPHLLFSNSCFVSFLLAFMFEVPLRGFVLANILTFLTKHQTLPSNDSLQSMILQIIQICSQFFPEEKFIVLVMELLQTLVEALIHQRILTKYFEPLCIPVFSSLNSLDNSELSRNYILVCIQFFALTTLTQSMNSLQISELENSIHIAFNDVIPQQLTNRLIQMIAGEVLPSLSPTFIIRQPKVLGLFLKISLKDNKLLDTINFLDQLCQFSALNCQSCHLSEFDHYLIDLIVEMKDSPAEIINAILTLFQRIASVMSSVSIVQRFISLLSPINGRKIPKNMNLYLRTINNIVSTASRLPVASLPLTENSAKIEIQGLNSTDLSNGFTFVFWINVDYSLAQYRPMIFSICDTKGRTLRWSLSGTNLFCTQRSNGLESNGKVNANLPISTWTFVAVSYNLFPEEKIIEMRTIFGSEEAKPLEFCEMNFQPGPLTCYIGGVAPKSVHSDLITRLGAFGLFKLLTPEQISSIKEMGPRLSGVLSETPFFFYHLDEVNDQLELKTKSAMSNIEAKMSFASIRFNTTFSDILINFCKVEILLPLFSELDMPMEDGEKYPNLVKTVIELLGNTLAISNRAQEMFKRASGFAIISHLLLSSSPKNIDYSLYLQFFTLMTSFTSENLQHEVLKYILLNMNIWIKTDADNHIRIVRHWARVIFPSLKYLISDLITFQDILFMLRAFYYYKAVNEEEDNIQIKRCDGLNVLECRQLMCNIATSLASESMTVEDFDCLASHCITCAETQQIPDLLRLLKSLIICHPSPLLRITSQIDVIYFLYSLFNRHSDEINCLIIDNVIAFHKYGILKQDSLQLHIIRLQNQLSPSILNEDLMKNLVNMMTSTYPEMLPICSLAAISLDEPIVLWFIEQLQLNPHSEYYQHFTWPMWPVILMFHSSQTVQIEMLKFFIKLPAVQWQNAFIMIIYVGFILEEDPSFLLKMFLQIILDQGIEKTITNYQIFFKLCSFYLFSPTKRQTTIMFNSIYQNSVFNDRTKNHLASSIPQRALSSLVKHPNNSNSGSSTSNSSRSVIIDKSCSIGTINYNNNSNGNCQKIMIKSKSMNLDHDHEKTGQLSSSSNHKLILNSVDVKEIGIDDDDDDKKNAILESKLICKSYSSSIDFQNYLNDTCNIDHIFERISSLTVPSSPYHFSLRFNKQMKWIDIEMAKKFADLFQDFGINSFLESYLIILSFICPEDPSFVQSHLSSINLSNEEVHLYEGALDLIIHHFHVIGHTIKIPNVNLNAKQKKEIEENAFHCIESHKFSQQHEINRLCLNLSFLLKELVKSSTKRLNIKNYPTLVYCQDQLTAISHLINKQLIDNKRKWMRLWRCLAIDHAPWDCNTHGEAHFKRDNTFCLHFCPFKIKRNWKFDDHKDAFITKGQQMSSESAAELLIKEDLEHRKSRYGIKAPLPLLEINDNDIDNVYSDEYIAYLDHKSKRGNKVDNSFMKKIIFKAECEYITPTTTTKFEINGVFFLTREFIRIIFADAEHRQPKTIYLSEIHSLFFRRSYHRPNSIEIFTTNGRCYYIHFKNHNSLAIIKKIASLPLPNAVNVQTVDFYQYFQKMSQTERWVNGDISNFEYIMHLNVMSGRTFNDLTQYPLFPWILSLYDSNEISFKNKESFRDLTKPVGALDNDRLNVLLKRFANMKDNNEQPYLYDTGSSYLSAACSYLLRLEPFTSEYVSILSGNSFKKEDFITSISESYKSVTKKFDDYRELIPEFFFMPEVFLNLNHYDFNNEQTENNKENGDVILPGWAKSAEDFIYKHREALESDYVSSVLNDWIDLIWGYKQRGEKAIEANNVFKPTMYDDIWNDTDSFKKNRFEIENILLYRGQVPPQLFKTKHPVKQKKPVIMYFSQPYLIAINTNGSYVAFSHVEPILSRNSYKITVVTVDGMMRTHTIDFTKLNKKTKHSVGRTQSAVTPKKGKQNQSSNGFSMISSISDSSLAKKIQTASNRSSFMNEKVNVKLNSNSSSSIINSQSVDSFESESAVSQIKDVAITVSTQRILGFAEQKIDIIERPNSVASLMKGKVAIISSVINKVMFVDINAGTIELMPCQLSDAVAIAMSNDLLAVAGNDAVLNIFKCENVIRAAAAVSSMKSSSTSTVTSISNSAPSSSSSISSTAALNGTLPSSAYNYKNNSNIGINNELFTKEEFIANVTPAISMPSYRDSISCCCLSQTFFASVIGTRDGSLIINSLNKGSTVRVIDLDGAKPCMVTMTPSWGFIVCYATKLMAGRLSHYLYVFNVNGIKLGKKDIGFEINCWSHSTSPKGFDYMLISDDRGKLFSFEVFKLDIGEAFFRCHSPVVSLEYLKELHAVLIVTKDGRIIFIPYFMY